MMVSEASRDEVPPPRAPARAAALATLLAAAGAGVGYVVGSVVPSVPWLRRPLEALGVPDLFVLPLLTLLVLAVHELGHLLGGFSRGMRFLLLIVGPFQWTRSPGGIRFKWVFNLGTMGGVAAATPDPGAPLTPQLRRLVLGGPVASLVLAACGAVLLALLEGRMAAYGLIVAGLSFLIFIVTAVPLRAGGFMSDGMQLLELARGGAAVTERQLLLRLMAGSYAGQRPRDWDSELVQGALALQSAEPLRRIAGRLFGLYHAMDRASDAEVRAHADWLGRHIHQYPDGFRQSISIELCLVAAQHGDLEAARRWWKQSRGGVVDPARRALVEASLAAAEGDAVRMERALATARRALPRGSDPGLDQLTVDQLDRLRSTATEEARPVAAGSGRR